MTVCKVTVAARAGAHTAYDNTLLELLACDFKGVAQLAADTK